jgi:chemotaxis protein methyltransferase CheR
MVETVLARMASLRILGRSPVGAYLRLNEWVWDRLPRSVRTRRPVHSFGHLVHSLVRLQDRRMYLGTFFLRNRPELELIGRLSTSKGKDRAVKIAILGPSNGAEVYSIAWAIRSAHPEVDLRMEAVDISAEVVEAAQNGVYRAGRSELVDEPIFDRMTAKEMEEMFDRDGDWLRVKPWIKEGIVWRVGDAADPGLAAALGPQDIVVANRFLCHMRPLEAEQCLRNLARLVAPGGHLFVSGVDLDVRTKVAAALGWTPVPDLLEEIHEGDPSLRASWPHRYWGLEPIDKGRPDWKIRYASVFQLGAGEATSAGPSSPSRDRRSSRE